MDIKYAFLINTQKCTRCSACSMACKNYPHQTSYVAWKKVYPLSDYSYKDKAFFSLACNHCKNPLCLTACPTHAYSKRADGIVIHNQKNCIGCKNCVLACPYGTPTFDPISKQAKKCSMCHERIDAGLLPECVAACPTKALSLANLYDLLEDNLVQESFGYPYSPELNSTANFISYGKVYSKAVRSNK